MCTVKYQVTTMTNIFEIELLYTCWNLCRPVARVFFALGTVPVDTSTDLICQFWHFGDKWETDPKVNFTGKGKPRVRVTEAKNFRYVNHDPPFKDRFRVNKGNFEIYLSR